MGKPILVPKGDVTSLGSAIFAFWPPAPSPPSRPRRMQLCPGYRTIEPEPVQAAA